MSVADRISTDLPALREALAAHPCYGMLQSVADLRRFMECHVYSVWDFMSLVKSMQALIAPAVTPWLPVGDPTARRFINSIVLEEESDWATPEGDNFLSHFELYRVAMREVGADTDPIDAFLAEVRIRGIDHAIAYGSIPEPSRAFLRTTFDFIASGKPHVVAAALAHGREHVIPPIFRRLLAQIGVGADRAPRFHFYLERHIELDEDFHAPMSLQLLDHLCGADESKRDEAALAAIAALTARQHLWDGVAREIAIARAALSQRSLERASEVQA